MVKISPEDRISAEELIDNSYFDEIRIDLEIQKPSINLVDATVKFTSVPEAVEFLVREIELLSSVAAEWLELLTLNKN